MIEARTLNGRPDDPIRLCSNGVLLHPYPHRLDNPPPWEGVTGNPERPLGVFILPPGQREINIQVEIGGHASNEQILAGPVMVNPMDPSKFLSAPSRLVFHAYRHEIDSPWGRCWSTIIAAFSPMMNAWFVAGEPHGVPAESLCPELLTGRPSSRWG